MKKIILISVLSVIPVISAMADTPWWMRPTICRLDTTACYPSMGIGYDSQMWDADSKCWGMKYICHEALKNPDENNPELIGKNKISNKIKSDFDANILSGDCFGARKTAADGSQVLVNGVYQNVWCNGVLSNPSNEIVPNGELATTEPTCTQLATDGYAAVKNKNCYGKYYDPMQYHIECDSGNTSAPKRLIILNGASPETASGNNTINTLRAATNRFDDMYTVSQQQRKQHFPD